MGWGGAYEGMHFSQSKNALLLNSDRDENLLRLCSCLSLLNMTFSVCDLVQLTKVLFRLCLHFLLAVQQKKFIQLKGKQTEN